MLSNQAIFTAEPVKFITEHFPALSVYTISKFNVLKAVAHIDSLSPAMHGIAVNIYTPVPGKDLSLDEMIGMTGNGHSIVEALCQCGFVDGVRMFNYKTEDGRTKGLAERMKGINAGHPQFEVLKKQARKIGAEFTGWSKDKETFTECYYAAGFDRLRLLGYDIYKVF